MGIKHRYIFERTSTDAEQMLKQPNIPKVVVVIAETKTEARRRMRCCLVPKKINPITKKEFTMREKDSKYFRFIEEEEMLSPNLFHGEVREYTYTPNKK